MNGKIDIFVRDTCRGVSTACTPSTIRVSLASDGTEADGDSTNPVISCDGRFVAFQSVATNLVPNDTNAVSDVFVRDTCLGATGSCTPSTALGKASLSFFNQRRLTWWQTTQTGIRTFSFETPATS